MTKWFSTILIFALFGAGTARLLAADGPPDKPALQEESDKRRDERKKTPPEEGEAKIKEWRKTNGIPSREDWEKKREQFRNMTPEEREAKRKEIKARLETRIAELRAKQTNSTITPQEGRELERREQILKRFEQGGSGPSRGERPKPILTNSPAQN